MDIKIGADPEVFVLDKASGVIINADGMVNGTKQEPEPVELGAVQVDGMALEFNIVPANTEEEFKRNITEVQRRLNEMIGIDKYDLMHLPSVVFDDDVMANASLMSKLLGCEPDFNAWEDGMVNPPPNAETNMRTGAGHIHIGWDENLDVDDISHIGACVTLTKQLDCSLGVQSLLWDKDTDRRELYGKAGAFRPKPYGAEYRVLSNAWLASEKLIGHVYKVAVKSVNDLMGGINYFEGIDVRECINSGDVASANNIMENLSNKYGVPAYV